MTKIAPPNDHQNIKAETVRSRSDKINSHKITSVKLGGCDLAVFILKYCESLI